MGHYLPLVLPDGFKRPRHYTLATPQARGAVILGERPRMLADLTPQDKDAMQFKMIGGGEDDPPLDFRR